MLAGIDVLLFDIQDIGARPYTYVWTMTFAMEEAAARHPLHRARPPQPGHRAAEGPLMQWEMRRRGPLITGAYPVPLRHGLTAGELARYVNASTGWGRDLTVVPVRGWHGLELVRRDGAAVDQPVAQHPHARRGALASAGW
jgi:uncharacterized protein YbbC (DUF1343 family)